VWSGTGEVLTLSTPVAIISNTVKSLGNGPLRFVTAGLFFAVPTVHQGSAYRS